MNLGVIGMGGGELVLVLFILPIVLLTTVFWIWMLVSAIQNKGLTDTEKICWVLAIIFLHVLGALLYLVIAHSKRPPPQKEAA
jgi:heme/copper-type cytochrome/quinol oxidase subunit 2